MHKDNRVKEYNIKSEKLFNFRPILFIALFLCAGIVFTYATLLKGFSNTWLLALLPVVVFPFFFCKNKADCYTRAVAVAGLLLAFFVGLGVSRLQFTAYTYNEAFDYGESAVVGRVVEKAEYDTSVRVLLDDVYIDGERVQGKLNAYLPRTFDIKIQLSDNLLLVAAIEKNTAPFGEYGFRASEISNNVRYFARGVKVCEVTGHDFQLFHELRNRIERVVYAGMDDDTAAVTMAVLTGDTSGMDEGLLENTRRGGIAHIFAVSGLHVGALYAFCLLLFQKTFLRKLPKGARFGLLATLFFLYGGICGFSPSIVRASVICSVAYAFSLLGIKGDFLTSLGAAAIVILLFSPVALFEVGFQLSFAACFGIALFAKPLRDFTTAKLHAIVLCFSESARRERAIEESVAPHKRDTRPLSIVGGLKNNAIAFLSASIAAQVTTAPLLLYYFGYISCWSLVLNCLFVPLIGALFSVLLSFVLIASILPIAVSGVILYIPNVVWAAVLLLFYAFDFSSFCLTGIKLSIIPIFLFYLWITFFSDKWNLSPRWKSAAKWTLIFGFAVTMYALNV